MWNLHHNYRNLWIQYFKPNHHASFTGLCENECAWIGPFKSSAEVHTLDSLVDGSSKHNCSLSCKSVKKGFVFWYPASWNFFQIQLLFPFHLCSISLKIKISGAMKLFCISFNITFSPCNCAEFIVHGPRPSPSNFRLYKQQSLPFAHATKPGSHTVLLSEGDACWGAWGRALHTVSSHLPFPFGAEAPHFFQAKLIFFWKQHLALWQLHRSYLGRLRVSPAFITWFRILKGFLAF